MHKRDWTENDIIALKGQEESIRMEFKSGALIDNNSKDKWVAVIAKEVSAFANTEGGTLILGLKEEKTKDKIRVASDPDGVPNTYLTDQIQSLIESNVSPYLSGLQVKRVPITSLKDRVVFVVTIPQGTTAYQAKDGKYYGRSELKVKFLPDHEIRLRMSRGRVAKASLEFQLCNISLSSIQVTKLKEKNKDALAAYKIDAAEAFQQYPKELLEIMSAGNAPDVFEFELILRNTGELTIRDPAIQISEKPSETLAKSTDIFSEVLNSRIEMLDEVIFPGDVRKIEGSKKKFHIKPETSLTVNDYEIHWKIYLDNSPPSFGTIDFGDYIKNLRL